MVKALLKLLDSPLGLVLLLLEVLVPLKGGNEGSLELLFHNLGNGVSEGGLREE